MKPIRCLLTAGPTREHLDPIRFLSNGSSGKMGYALTRAAVRRGWQVNLVSGPVSLKAPEGASVTSVISAQEMYKACAELFPLCDVFICVAAVADYRPRNFSPVKLKKETSPLQLELEPTTDILKTLAADKIPHQLVVGFAAETHDVEASAIRKLKEKKLDWIVANDVSVPGLGMNADRNRVILFSKSGERLEFGPATKDEVADFILGALGLGGV